MVENRGTTEDIAFRRITEPLKAETVLSTASGMLGVAVSAFRERRRNSALRAVAARMLTRFAAETQRQVADHLEMGTGGAVSAQVRRLPALLEKDPQLRRTVARIEKKLVQLKERQSLQTSKPGRCN